MGDNNYVNGVKSKLNSYYKKQSAAFTTRILLTFCVALWVGLLKPSPHIVIRIFGATDFSSHEISRDVFNTFDL